jgi:hypothetical protein
MPWILRLESANNRVETAARCSLSRNVDLETEDHDNAGAISLLWPFISAG